MDPRHPELAISRMRELMKQYDRIENDMAKATTSAKLAELEREGGLVVQEICLTAPRMHEALIQTSRMRRRDLASGAVFGYKPEEKVGKYTKATIAIEEKPESTEEKETISKKETVAKKNTKKKTTKKKKEDKDGSI